MRVEATKQAVLRGETGGSLSEGTHGHTGEDRPQSRALVVTAPARAPELTSRPRQVAFLAHLIATKMHAPQTRERRRAEPNEALAAYRAAAALIR